MARVKTLEHPMAGKLVEDGVTDTIESEHATVKRRTRFAQVPPALASVMNTPGDMPAKLYGVTACADR